MAKNIRKGLLQFVFSGSYMKRWNDKLRCIELIEIDKQAHKMLAAWLLCQLEGKKLSSEERLQLERQVVEGGIFDYLFRLVITDIKPPVLYRIKEDHEQYDSLARWALKELEPHCRPLGDDFWEAMQAYILNPKPQGQAADILAAAHLYASAWEFQIIKPLNEPFDEEMGVIAQNFIDGLQKYSHISGVSELLQGIIAQDKGNTKNVKELPALARFANLCGQLRFQKRWSQTPRIPETSVMGHMFMVACFSYFISMSFSACDRRKVNNFFCGLFHDIPEMLTRDIISPVKKSSEALNSIIKAYEEKELERRVFALLLSEGHEDIVERISYYLGISSGSEFDNTVILNGEITEIKDFEAFHLQYNENKFDPKDGEAIKVCDILAAYIEAYTAIRNGIASEQVQQAFWRMREQQGKRVLGDFHLGALFTDFD